MLKISFGSVQSILMVNGQWKNVWNLLINTNSSILGKKICAKRDNLESRHFELNWLRAGSNMRLLYQQHQTSAFKSIFSVFQLYLQLRIFFRFIIFQIAGNWRRK